MKASKWKCQQRVQIIRPPGASDRWIRLRNAGYTTDRPPEKIDGLIKIEVKLDDGDLVLLPVHLITNI